MTRWQFQRLNYSELTDSIKLSHSHNNENSLLIVFAHYRFEKIREFTACARVCMRVFNWNSLTFTIKLLPLIIALSKSDNFPSIFWFSSNFLEKSLPHTTIKYIWESFTTAYGTYLVVFAHSYAKAFFLIHSIIVVNLEINPDKCIKCYYLQEITIVWVIWTPFNSFFFLNSIKWPLLSL